MISSKFKKIVFDWNYHIFEPVIRGVGLSAIVVHLLFYFTMHHDSADLINFIARMVIVALYIPLLFYPTKDWKTRHKIYLESILAVTMPGFFTLMLLSDIGTYWAVTLIFIVIYYGVFARWQFALFMYPISVSAAFVTASIIYSERFADMHEVIQIHGIALLALILVEVLKFFVEKSHNQIVVMKEKTEQQNEIFSALLDISVEVSRFDDLDEIFHLLLKRFETIFPKRGFGLLVEGPRPKIIQYMAFRGISQKDTTFLLQVHPYVLGFANVSLENDEETLSSIEGDDWQVFGGGIRSSSIQGKTFYCFKLFIKGRSLDGDERKTLEVFLETIRGMTRSRIQALELERYSNTDQLTGLFNRNYFDRVFEEWKEKARPEKPFSVIFGDINGLKRINDTYGHHAGDLLIKSCTNLLIHAARNSDLVFRLGGDEVVVLCPSTKLPQADELVKRIRAGMETLIVPCANETTGEVTEERAYISFGAACSTEHGPEEVVALADKRMFDAKEKWYREGKRERYR